MSDYIRRDRRTPWWMTLVIVICMLPVLAFPFVLGHSTQIDLPDYILWFYPVYVLVDGLCAWIVYGERPAVAWILLIVMVLSHIGVYMLI